MLFKLHKSFTKGFTQEGFPKVLQTAVQLMNKSNRFYYMDNYLKNTLGLKTSSKEILLTAIKSSYIIERDDYFNVIIGTKNNYLDTDYTLEGLVHLIERGNLEVKGTDALQKAFIYFITGANNFLHMYLGGRL